MRQEKSKSMIANDPHWPRELAYLEDNQELILNTTDANETLMAVLQGCNSSTDINQLFFRESKPGRMTTTMSWLCLCKTNITSCFSVWLVIRSICYLIWFHEHCRPVVPLVLNFGFKLIVKGYPLIS